MEVSSLYSDVAVAASAPASLLQEHVSSKVHAAAAEPLWTLGAPAATGDATAAKRSSGSSSCKASPQTLHVQPSAEKQQGPVQSSVTDSIALARHAAPRSSGALFTPMLPPPAPRKATAAAAARAAPAAAAAGPAQAGVSSLVQLGKSPGASAGCSIQVGSLIENPPVGCDVRLAILLSNSAPGASPAADAAAAAVGALIAAPAAEAPAAAGVSNDSSSCSASGSQQQEQQQLQQQAVLTPASGTQLPGVQQQKRLSLQLQLPEDELQPVQARPASVGSPVPTPPEDQVEAHVQRLIAALAKRRYSTSTSLLDGSASFSSGSNCVDAQRQQQQGAGGGPSSCSGPAVAQQQQQHGGPSASRRGSSNVAAAQAPRLRYTAKVCDFGFSQCLRVDQSHCSTAAAGTLTHQAPEVLRAGHLSPAADIYAFGIIREWGGLSC
eukprot:GHRQ01009002.1.p1 GENE.GHRQ01009002.1~~GHRQ01009002.1.p1  ORF type:complete len:484 (+),score=227.41 GHRQ01009002.1:139-1452(+)